MKAVSSFPAIEALHLIFPHQANVLMDKDGIPRITDFGISRLMEDSTLWNTSKTSADGSTRWMAPELLSGNVPQATIESDIYAFAMTILVSLFIRCAIRVLKTPAKEILTGEAPYAKMYPRNEQVIVNVIMHGARPLRPHQEVFSDDLWKLLEQCWNSDPKLRGSIDEVADKLIALQESSIRILSIGK
jgi:serine/threonine protein kinase